MLFELLYLTRDGERPPKFSIVEKTLRGIPQLRKGEKGSDGEISFDYESTETGVQFRFVRYQAEDEDEIGLAFELPCPRSSYYAQEALPVAILVARELNLAVDVLVKDGSELVENPSFEDLMDLWQAQNRDCIDESKVFACPSDQLEAMWEFSLLRGDLSRRYGRNGVKIPAIGLLKEKRSGQVGRIADWEALSPVAFGELEWIRLIDPPKPLQNGSIYSAEELIAAAKPLIRAVPQPIFHHLFDKRAVRNELIERIEPLKRKTIRSFERLEIETVVDAEFLGS